MNLLIDNKRRSSIDWNDGKTKNRSVWSNFSQVGLKRIAEELNVQNVVRFSRFIHIWETKSNFSICTGIKYLILTCDIGCGQGEKSWNKIFSKILKEISPVRRLKEFNKLLLCFVYQNQWKSLIILPSLASFQLWDW